MKKVFAIMAAMLLLITTVPMGTAFVAAEEKPESVVLNVKDFGAVGDGKTDDEAAIWATFECALMDYMVNDIPVTVYFPEGQYGLKNGGLYVYLPRGAGNLTVKGDGADKSTIVYLEEWTNSGSWVALRIYPRITPTSIDEYLHDITIQDLGVYDTDPLAHAWHKDKGDPDTEETHGFNIQHCIRATIKNCKVVDAGDECFDLSHCIDSVMTENLVVKNRITGKGGGSFSVGDGSKNVTVSNNTVIFDTDDASVSHYGFAVEALTEHVEDVYIINNAAQNINGWGVSLGAPNGTIDDVLVQNNLLIGCKEGGIRFVGSGLTTNTKVLDNDILNTCFGISIDGMNKENTLVDGCTIENLTSYGVSVNSPRNRNNIIQNTVIRNAKWRAFYNAGTNTLFDRVLVDGSGTAGNITDSAVIQYTGGGDCTISNSVFLNCRNKRGIQGVAKVINTYIQQPEISGYTSITGVALIQNCWVNRMVTLKSGYTVDGLTLTTTEDLGTHAIVLSNLTDCTVTNCRITIPSRYGISEAGTADRNTITNNVIIGGNGIKTVGAETVAEGNIRSTLVVGEQFTYRVVDGTATVMAPVDPTLTELEIPAAIDGAPVVSVDPWAFALCASLTTVSIPDTLSSVGAYAFYDCSALTTVNYGGLEPQRQALILGDENTALTDAEWTYHWNNHTYDNACDPDCNDCPVIREVGEHVYDNACDAACNECGFVREVPDHVYEAAVTAPDCVNGGYTTYTCTVCGNSYVADETTALGHTYDGVETAPDCVNDGYTTYTCTACGDSYVADETTALGHDYDNACDVDCNTCGVLREVADHVYDSDTDADCNECGFVREVITLGDVDGNGKVNNRDLGLVQRYLNGSNLTNFVEVAADLDGNGKINNRDLGLLQKKLNQ